MSGRLLWIGKEKEKREEKKREGKAIKYNIGMNGCARNDVLLCV
jgi:hypothetical protein